MSSGGLIYTEHIDQLIECPNCHVEFVQTNPNHKFCSYGCYGTFMDWVKSPKIHQSFNGAQFMRSLLNTHRLELEYLYPPLWKTSCWWDYDELEDEFVYLMERDK